MITSFWLIVATALCIYFICTGKNYMGIPKLILICLLCYMFAPIILFGLVLFFVFKALTSD